MGLKGNYLVSFLWGLAEATFFFIVPDVFLSYLSVKYNLKVSIISALFSLVGALIGGLVLYHLGKEYSQNIILFIVTLPAISPEMIESVELNLKQSGLISLFTGAISGVPYKIFAVQAGQLSIPMGAFIAVSIPARLFRWFLVIFISNIIGKHLSKRWSKNVAIKALLLFWVIFYSLFFLMMPN